MEEFDIKNGSLLIVPNSFTPRNDITMTSNLRDTADDIQHIIKADIEDIKRSEQGNGRRFNNRDIKSIRKYQLDLETDIQ